MAQEFLPLCDVLFNIISLAAYFCDIVFDLVTVYTLFATNEISWFSFTLSVVMISLITCQITSLQWYLRRRNSNARQILILVTIHCLQSGVLWRYFKLFVPVDLRHVKLDVRDLCVLRMIHAFCESIPMLMVQLYLIWCCESISQITRLNIVSTLLSLFNVCWALASFNKYIRRKNVHKLVLTWLGVVSQLLWRLGTVSSRIVVLSVYATLYHHWTLLVIFLHWLSMFLWLISPKNIFHGEKISWVKKYVLSMIIGFIYVFSYVNLQETNAWHKIAAFYVTMLLENTLLMSVWLAQRPNTTWFEVPAVLIVWGGYAMGVMFMIIYYQCFHIKRMKYDVTSDTERVSPGDNVNCAYNNTSASENNFKTNQVDVKCNKQMLSGMSYVPGVFNCRLNPALKRKKKKPTSFVPPPVTLNGGRMESPFWKKLPPKSGSSDQDGSSVGSRVNIQQKLQEKKQKQIQELKEIEEEIKQGKIARPRPIEIENTQPIPRSKKRPPSGRLKSKHRCKTPEVLLSPHYLENCRVYYDYSDCQWKCGRVYLNNNPSEISSSNFSNSYNNVSNKERNLIMYKSYRLASDLDSQISLPRSYTLPREFRYYKKSRSRKPVRSEYFAVTSTNSSDGDVDSADEMDGKFLTTTNVWPNSRTNCFETKL